MPLSSPCEAGAGARVVQQVRRILSNWDKVILQPREGALVNLGRTHPSPQSLLSFMAKLEAVFGDVTENAELVRCRYNGIAEERNHLEEACMKVNEMSGKIIEGVAAAITKASEDAVVKMLEQVEGRLVDVFLKAFEKSIKEDIFYSTLPPESITELKEIVRKWYEEAEGVRLEDLADAITREFRGSSGLSTRSRQEGSAGVCNGGDPRVHEPSVPPSSVGGHVGSAIASPPSRGRHPISKSGEDHEVIVLDQSPHPKTSAVDPNPLLNAFSPLWDILQGLGKNDEKGVVEGEKSGAPTESVAVASKRAGG
ncbi:unnamed protein product [Closterium sp. NIES-53]